MKIFCSKCGVAKEVEDTARGAYVTCSACGTRFNAGGVAPVPASGSSSTIITVVAVVVAVPIVIAMIGILAAIAIPNFIKFQSRSKQAECKSNLKTLYAAERSYFEEHQQYASAFAAVGFSPERGNRYAYFTETGTMEARDVATPIHRDGDTEIGVDVFRYPGRGVTRRDVPPTVASGLSVGTHGGCPDCSIVAVCVGNIDGDDTLDVWSISTAARTAPSGESIRAGEPYNDVNDNDQ